MLETSLEIVVVSKEKHFCENIQVKKIDCDDNIYENNRCSLKYNCFQIFTSEIRKFCYERRMALVTYRPSK